MRLSEGWRVARRHPVRSLYGVPAKAAIRLGHAMAEEVDVVVIGLGVGGEEVGGKLASAGLRVVGIERRLVGGECPYWGCVPSKMMIRAANLIAESRRAPGLVGPSTIAPD